MNPNDAQFEINAPGIDTGAIVRDIRASVAEKMEQGLYSDPAIARAEQTNLSNFKDKDEFQAFYLECLRQAVFVDINDFDIIEKRRGFTALLTAFKRTIWKSLKFYTYRLWSQQNRVNGLLLSAVETTEERYRDKLKKIEDRLSKLESLEEKGGRRV